MIGIIDCRNESTENDFLTLNLWGRPVFAYIIEEALNCKAITETLLLTESRYLIKLAKEIFGNKIKITDKNPNFFPAIYISGGAVLLKSQTLKKVIEQFRGGGDIFCEKIYIL